MQLSVAVSREFVSQISKPVALLNDCVAFLGPKKNILNQEPQNYTTIILPLLRIFSIVAEIVERKILKIRRQQYWRALFSSVPALFSAFICKTAF
jgi:hypothetical protein